MASRPLWMHMPGGSEGGWRRPLSHPNSWERRSTAMLYQNIAAMVMLLRGVPEPVDPQERAVYQNLRALVEATAIQQAESSTS